jgi:hypothetical protein
MDIDTTVNIVFIAPPLVMALFMALLLAFLAYYVAKFVISIYTGA